MLLHMLRRAIGTTGTGRRSRMRSTPDLKAWMSPSGVSRPSGKISTSSPSARAASMPSKARSIIAASSFGLAIGIAPAARKIQLITGIWKIR